MLRGPRCQRFSCDFNLDSLSEIEIVCIMLIGHSSSPQDIYPSHRVGNFAIIKPQYQR